MRRVKIILAGALILGLSGCAKYEIPQSPCPVGNENVSFSGDIQPIFNQSCVACHSGTVAPDLSEGWAYDELMDGDYVDTDFPCESQLYKALTEIHGDKATEEELLKILGWIQDGAEDN